MVRELVTELFAMVLAHRDELETSSVPLPPRLASYPRHAPGSGELDSAGGVGHDWLTV